MAGIADEPPPGLFFAGSDDEDEDDVDMPGPEMSDEPRDKSVAPSTPPSCSSRASVCSRRSSLFLPGSDDEDFTSEVKKPTSTTNKRQVVVDDALHSDVEILGVEEIPQVSSLSSPAGHLSLSPVKTAHRQEPPVKKRRLSPKVVSAASPVFPPTYIGEVLIPDAWSTTSGNGIIKPNETILIQREEPDIPKSVSSKAPPNGKKSGGKKQMSLINMFKSQTPKNFQKKKTDTIVRLLNKNGVEFGRLPKEASLWIARLLDYGIVEIRGVISDCPEKLTTGPHNSSLPDDPFSLAFNEGMETQDESMLRERKSSILKLFDVVGLKPQAGAKFKGKQSEKKLHEEALKRVAKAKKVTEIVGDGEEIEVDDSEELSNNDIDMIYKRAQHNDRAMGEMEPSDTFTLTLRAYQKQALLWMHSLETGKMDARESTSMHPLWSQYAFPQPILSGDFVDLTADDKLFYFNPYSGELSLEFPKAKRDCRGGILADGTLGMGKTIMLSALIQTSMPTEAEIQQDEKKLSKSRQLKLNSAFRTLPQRCKSPSATLIVAPTSLLAQWSEEIQRSSKPGSVRVLVWHGQNRLDLESVINADDDDDDNIRVVITSYGVLASEHAKSEKSSSTRSPIFEVEWLRVVLDEAHACKSRSSKTAKAVYALQARRRWAVTGMSKVLELFARLMRIPLGTPIVNKLEDLYSLLKFLNFKPWSDFSFFRSFITLPFLARDTKAIEIVQVILESILLRREKNMTDASGAKIVDLPPKEVTVETLEFSLLERKIYDSIYNTAKRNFDQLNAKGLVSRNYTHILAMLMRLRRAVLHPNLVLTADDERALSPAGDGKVDVNELIKQFVQDESSSSGTSNTFAENVLVNIAHDDAVECPICFDVIESPMVVPNCMHQFCKDCILVHLVTCEEKGHQLVCPTCSTGPIKKEELVEIVRKKTGDENVSQNSQPDVILRRNDFQNSTKLEALIKDLRRLRDQDPCFRAVVFSQFTSFLDLIQTALERENFEQYRFDGTMDIKKKNAAVNEFKAPSRKPKVLIVSLKAGGVGLNLTAANHVFMMDCWWNAATENQAIDRVHRIGQDKTVYVKHFIVGNTIEGRVLQIQKRKTAIVKEAFRGSSTKGGKPDPESLQNLKIMFGDD